RSVPVQLALLGATFVGAIGLAVVTVCLRSTFFEPYVRETYAPAAEDPLRLVARLERPASAKKSEPKDSLEAATEEAQKRAQEAADWDALYALWMNPRDEGPDPERVRRLLWTQPEATLERIRATSVVGRPAQRARALELLVSIPASAA